MITNHHWGSTTSVGGSGANLRFTPYNVPLLERGNFTVLLRQGVQRAEKPGIVREFFLYGKNGKCREIFGVYEEKLRCLCAAVASLPYFPGYKRSAIFRLGFKNVICTGE